MTSSGNNLLPVGSIIAWALEINPDDSYLECNGQTVNSNKYPKLYALMHNTPDYRGVFLRGLGGNSANLGELQSDATRNFSGSFYATNIGHNGTDGVFSMISTGITHENMEYKHQVMSYYKYNLDLNNANIPVADEIRPINRAVRYFIKAK
ncbi:phage tail protein [Megamonas hypermegale]|uniref:phage tail protein n=1 Tax=Megamonas hypermegale TaxID=158847 RepID=UPI0026EAB341|nr:phage tail protein [Megamonas hypermegale]